MNSLRNIKGYRAKGGIEMKKCQKIKITRKIESAYCPISKYDLENLRNSIENLTCITGFIPTFFFIMSGHSSFNISTLRAFILGKSFFYCQTILRSI